MRLALAGALATVTAGTLALIPSALLTDEERLATESIRATRLSADVRFLSSDLLEGRAPGTRGDRLARAYVAARFEALGFEPGTGAGFEQPVELVGVTTHAPDPLRLTRGAEAVRLRLNEDYVAFSGSADPEVHVTSAEVVFVGYGIVAPEYQWNDYEGVDVRGKVVLVMNNDPEHDPKLFAGKRRLYYGRWDYKYQTAAQAGAAGAIVIHTSASAGYSWSVVQNSWSGEQQSLPAAGEAVLPFQAWATEDACRRIAALAGQDLDALRARAEAGGFRPVPLGVTLDAVLRNEVVRRTSANVVARLPGSDPALGKEAVLYTAHHDHYGIKPSASGGPEMEIYNGALDNASGVAAMLAVAEAFAALEERPRRSVMFASVTAEEQGLLGSQYLARHLPLPAGLVAANINVDGVSIWGRTRDVPVVGLGKSTLDEWLRAIAEMQGRRVVAEAFPDKGAYYRSDHLSFARLGIPATFLEPGTEIVGKPPGWGREQRQAWQEAHYHQPSDDLTPDWSFEGAVEDARLLFLLGVKVANAPLAPTWRPGDEFEAARRRSLAEIGR